MPVLDREGLRAIVSSLTGLTDFATDWDVDPNRPVGDMDQARVGLTLFGLSAVGVDEHRRALGPAGYPATTFVTTEIGNRDVRISIRAETFAKGVEAAELIDAIRTGIRAQAVTDKLNAINLAFQWAEKTTRLPTVYDERVVSCAAADFTFGGVAQLVSNVEDDSGWISTVNTDNTVPGTLS